MIVKGLKQNYFEVKKKQQISTLMNIKLELLKFITNRLLRNYRIRLIKRTVLNKRTPPPPPPNFSQFWRTSKRQRSSPHVKGQMHHHDDLGSRCAYTCHLSNKTTRKSVLLSTPQIWLMKVSKILA